MGGAGNARAAVVGRHSAPPFHPQEGRGSSLRGRSRIALLLGPALAAVLAAGALGCGERPARPRAAHGDAEAAPGSTRSAVAAGNVPAAEAPSPSLEPPTPSSEPPSVSDAAGRPVRLARPARRIISLIPSVNEIFLALGAGDRIVARTDYDLQPALAHLPSVGGGLTPSVEWLVARHPDLVVAWPDERSRSLVAHLTNAGVAVYAARIQSIEDAFRVTRDMGTLLGLPGRAAALDAQLRAGLDSVRAAVAARPRPTVLYLIGTDPPMAAGAGTFVDELLGIAGARNILEDAGAQWPQVSVEEVVRRDPDVILVAVAGEGAHPLDRLRALPGWRTLRAVRAGRVMRLDPYLSNRPGPRIAEAARRLAALLHPSRTGGTP